MLQIFIPIIIIVIISSEDPQVVVQMCTFYSLWYLGSESVCENTTAEWLLPSGILRTISDVTETTRAKAREIEKEKGVRKGEKNTISQLS